MKTLAPLLLLSTLLCAQAQASPPEQTPLTGRMLGTATTAPDTTPPAVAATAAPAPSDAWSPDPRAAPIGDTTRWLLQLQASGRQAAPLRPIPGAQADASYRRYLRSFERDIPEFFKTTVDSDTD